MMGWKIRRWRMWVILCLILLGLIPQGSTLLHSIGRNQALLALAQALISTPKRESHVAVYRAESLLRRELSRAPEKRALWRGLGFVLALQERQAEALTAWRRAGHMAQELLDRGVQARQAGQYDDARVWLHRSIGLAPSWAAPWYQLGLVCEAMEQWQDAPQNYQRARASKDFSGIGRSLPAYRMGQLYQDRLKPPQWENALAAYDAALSADDFPSDREAADCHFRRGRVLERLGAPFRDVIAAFRKAIAIQPNGTPWVYLKLANILYQQDHDVTAAETEIRKAIALDPENKWVYFDLGRIYHRAGRRRQALTMYGRALSIDPTFDRAQRQRATLLDAK